MLLQKSYPLQEKCPVQFVCVKYKNNRELITVIIKMRKKDKNNVVHISYYIDIFLSLTLISVRLCDF